MCTKNATKRLPKKSPPPLHLALALLRSPRQPHQSLGDRELRSSMARGVVDRTDLAGPIAGGTKFHPAVGQRGGPPTSGYNLQRRRDLRKYPTVAAPPSIGRGSFKRRMLSSLFYKAGEFIKRRGNVRGPLKIPRSLRILYSHNYVDCTWAPLERLKCLDFLRGLWASLNASIMKSHTIIVPLAYNGPNFVTINSFSLNFGFDGRRDLFTVCEPYAVTLLNWRQVL